MSRSAKNKGNMNATGTGFEVKDVRQVMDFKVFKSALGSYGVISSHLEINIFHISYAIIFYPFLFQFYISGLDELRIREI